MELKVEDRLFMLSIGKVEIGGYLGQKLDTCINKGIMATKYPLFIIPYRDKTDDSGIWGGEFWGKWFTSSALAYRYQPTADNKQILDKAVSLLIKTQESDGRISSCKNDFGDWDIWGRKYVLLGLLAYYDQTGDKKVLEVAARAVDALIEVAGPQKRKLTETGLSVLEALASCSILEPIALLYQRCGNEKYLDFAKYLVSLWSEPNAYTKNGICLVEDALGDVPPVKISSPKGYEMMSCYEGLCELYRATGYEKYLQATVRFGETVRRKEIMIVGSGSSGELWCDGINRQTELLEQPMETCVTATWIKFCYQLLRLTGNSVWADEMEITLYNSLIGAMIPQGNWWAYFSPLVGERMPSPLQDPLVNSSCCVVNGPRGLMTVPGWSVMTNESGIAVNLYSKGSWNCKINSGMEIQLLQETCYPENDTIEIIVKQEEVATYAINLRIPSWSKNTELSVEGQKIECIPGTYAKINRQWKNNDKITLKLDLRGRVITAPGSVNNKAIMRGPVVLALDNRLVKEEKVNLWLLSDQLKWKHNGDLDIDYVLLEEAQVNQEAEEFIELTPSKLKPDGVWMAFEVRFLIRPTHFRNHKKKTIIMCDYASAGNEYSEKNLFRVWMPQPMFMNYIFPRDTWKILTQDELRPETPEL